MWIKSRHQLCLFEKNMTPDLRRRSGVARTSWASRSPRQRDAEGEVPVRVAGEGEGGTSHPREPEAERHLARDEQGVAPEN